MARRKPQNDQRASLGPFVAIPHAVLDSAAWRTLGLRARCVLIEIVGRHNGFNNGAIGASLRDLAAATGTTSLRDTGAAIVELIGHGLIAIEAEGQRWERQAREYRVTWLPTGEPPHRRPATNEWRAFSSDDTASSARAVPDDTASSRARKLDDTALSRIGVKRRKTAIR